MTTQTTQPPATADAPKTYTQAELDAAVATARSEASTASQTRIAAILESDEGKQRPKQAAHLAFKTSMSADEAKGLMAASAVEVQGTSQAPAPSTPPAATGERSRDVAGGLALGAVVEGNGQEQEKKPAAINPTSIYANRAKAMGQVA